jgi:hypothetical protein
MDDEKIVNSSDFGTSCVSLSEKDAPLRPSCARSRGHWLRGSAVRLDYARAKYSAKPRMSEDIARFGERRVASQHHHPTAIEPPRRNPPPPVWPLQPAPMSCGKGRK